MRTSAVRRVRTVSRTKTYLHDREARERTGRGAVQIVRG
jgi:hypothetical protein